MDELARIQTFIRAVEAGSFSAVARDRSSISSVARQVKSLEDELGVRLLNRSTRNLSLTEPGRIFYERACVISNDLGNAISEVRSFQADVKGILRVSLRVLFGTSVVIPALPKFLEKYPDLKVEIELTDERRDLIANNIDVAIWIGDLPDSQVIARRLGARARVICGSPNYFEKQGIPKTPEDLLKHNCVLFTPRNYSRKWNLSKDNNNYEIGVEGNLSSDNGMALLSSALAGIGLIMCNSWMVEHYLAEERLIRVLSDYSVSPSPGEGDQPLYAVYASSRGMSLKIRAFVDFLVQLNEPETGLQQDSTVL